MPVLNEERHLAEAVGAVLGQDYPGDDRGRPRARAQHRRHRRGRGRGCSRRTPGCAPCATPSGRTPAALNLRARRQRDTRSSSGWTGTRCWSAHYVRTAVELLQRTGAANVGGVMAAEGTTDFERAVAAAMTSVWGVGAARVPRRRGEDGPADTVYLGVFRREWLDRVGGYDERFVRAQDWEMNHRIREAGGLVWFSPRLQVAYRPRATIARWPGSTATTGAGAGSSRAPTAAPSTCATWRRRCAWSGSSSAWSAARAGGRLGAAAARRVPRRRRSVGSVVPAAASRSRARLRAARRAGHDAPVLGLGLPDQPGVHRPGRCCARAVGPRAGRRAVGRGARLIASGRPVRANVREPCPAAPLASSCPSTTWATTSCHAWSPWWPRPCATSRWSSSTTARRTAAASSPTSSPGRAGLVRCCTSRTAAWAAPATSAWTPPRGEFVAFVDSDDIVPARRVRDACCTPCARAGPTWPAAGCCASTARRPRPSGLHARAIKRTGCARTSGARPSWSTTRRPGTRSTAAAFLVEHGLRFPEGVYYEDIPLTLPAHFLASSVDVIAEPVYLWRERQTDDQSITQRRDETKNLVDRMAAVRSVDDFLVGQGRRRRASGPRRARCSTWTSRCSSRVLDEDEEFREQVRRARRRLPVPRPAGRCARLPPRLRLQYHLISPGSSPS